HSLNAAESSPSGRAQALIENGLSYLKTQQKKDFSWQNQSDQPAVTAIVLKAFAGDKKHNIHESFIQNGYEKLLSYQKSSGGIYKHLLARYKPSIAVSALAEPGEDKDT